MTSSSDIRVYVAKIDLYSTKVWQFSDIRLLRII